MKTAFTQFHLLCAYLCVLYAAMLWVGYDPNGPHPLGSDFAIFYAHAQQVAQGQAAEIYPDAMHHLRRVMNQQVTLQGGENPLPYPPHFWLLLAPLGAVPFALAYALWMGMGVAAFYMALRLPELQAMMGNLQQYRWFWRYRMVWMLLSPLSILAWTIGQSTPLFASLLIAGLAMRKTRPWLAGLCFGLLTMKPSLGLLIPLLLVLEGNGRAIVSATCTMVVLVTASLLAFGVQPWFDFLPLLHQFSEMMTQNAVKQIYYMLSVNQSLNLLGVPSLWALLGHVVVMLGVLVWLFRAAWPALDDAMKFCACVLVSLLLSTYAMSYELLCLVPVVWVMLSHMHDVRGKRQMGWLYLLAVLPLLSPFMAKTVGVLVAPYLLLAWLFWGGFIQKSGVRMYPAQKDAFLG